MERDLEGLRALLEQPFRGYTPDAPVWGWDTPLVRSLSKAGYTDLPTPAQLSEIRALSSRRTAVEVLARLRRKLSSLPLTGESRFITTAEELAVLFPLCPKQNTQTKADISKSAALTPPTPTHILKEPYSSSGRGIRPTGPSLTPQLRQWALRCIREQGGVCVEPYYINKVMDLALEFTVTETEIRYDGLSVFLTHANNTYKGNVVAGQETLESMASRYIEPAALCAVRQALQEELSAVFIGKYLGPIGVDMMILQTDGGYALHPCLEINVRRTMGNLALRMPSLLPPGINSAVFTIVFGATPALLSRQIDRLRTRSLLSGLESPTFFELLTPLKPDTQFAAILTTVAPDRINPD